MKKDLFDIIKSKSYDELTDSERVEVGEMAEDAMSYDNLKKFMSDVDAMSKDQIVPSSKVQSNLNELFDQVHGQRRYAWYMSFAAIVIPKEKPLHKQPLFYAAAILLLALLVVPFSNVNLDDSSNVLAQQEVMDEESMTMSQQKEFSIEEEAVSTNVTRLAENEQQNSEVVMQDAVSTSTRNIEGLAQQDEFLAEEITVVTDFNSVPVSVTAVPTSAGMAHPDGVFDNWANESNFSIPASKQPELLDLLTATF